MAAWAASGDCLRRGDHGKLLTVAALIHKLAMSTSLHMCSMTFKLKIFLRMRVLCLPQAGAVYTMRIAICIGKSICHLLSVTRPDQHLCHCFRSVVCI